LQALGEDRGRPRRSTLCDVTHAALLFGVSRDANLGLDDISQSLDESDEIKQMRADAYWLRRNIERYDTWQDDSQCFVRYFRERGNEFGAESLGEQKSNGDIKLTKTHGAMIKFASEEDEDWKKVEDCLLKITQI
jgi:hypothetical protein